MLTIKGIILKTAKAVGYTVNPRTLEFGLHYLKGTQSEMTLNREEIEVTKEQIANTLKEGSIGIGDLCEAPGYTRGMKGWFSHPTAGVVGGFDYTVEEKQNGSVTCHCYDTWDFNPCHEKLYFIVPTTLIPMIKVLVKSLGLASMVSYEEYEDGKKTKVSVKESDLIPLNSKHAFVTRWDVEFSKEEWAALQQLLNFAYYEDEDEDEELDEED